MKRLPIAGPWVTDLEIDYVAEAARTAWYDDAATFTDRFEAAFAKHVGRRFAISLPSATSGIHLLLAALDVRPGDEVIVPDATWIASAAPVDYVGATPVFADVDPLTWCLDASWATEHVTGRTKAIVAVDLYGSMGDLSRLEQLAANHGFALIEDAAEAIGSAAHNRPAGSFGRASVFSFHGSKTMTTGEGGMVVTDDEQLFHRMMVLRDHGRSRGDVEFFNGEVAFKYKMSALQAAFGLAQLERLPELVDKKRQIFSWYAAGFAGYEGITLNAEPEGTINSYWMVTALLGPDSLLSAAQLRHQLGAQSIDTRPFFHPLSSLPAFRDRPESAAARRANVVAQDLATRGLNLPSALCLERADVDRVVDAVIAATGPQRRMVQRT